MLSRRRFALIGGSAAAFALIGASRVRFPHYVLLLTPFLAAAAGTMAARVLGRLRAPVAVALVGAALLPTALDDARLVRAAGAPDTRDRDAEFNSRERFSREELVERLNRAVDEADRVLAGVRVRRPWPARAAALLARLWPRGTRGWALAAAFLAFPVVLGGALAGWLLTRPGVTPWALWVFVRDRAGEALGALAARAASGVLESTLVLRAVQAVESLVTRAGVEALGAAAALFATLMLVSAWVLYQNLFRTPSRGAHHVSLSF